MNYLAPKADFSQVKTEADQLAWYIVLVILLLALGATLVLGAMAWCIAHGHGSFTGSWHWVTGGSVAIQCYA